MNEKTRHNEKLLFVGSMPVEGGLRPVDLLADEVARLIGEGCMVVALDKLKHHRLTERVATLAMRHDKGRVKRDVMALERELGAMGVDVDNCMPVAMEKGHVENVAEVFGRRHAGCLFYTSDAADD